MYESLKKHCNDFHLYIFAFDETSLDILNKLKLPKTTIISLSEFENNELLEIKTERSRAEYCWTCTPSTIFFCIEQYKLDHCTYVDADLYFYSNPRVLIDEMGDKSVLITEHRYTPEYDQSLTSGIYCVQFITFKNTIDGITVLKWWKNACIEWCYARFENGKFGDQKYLDDWTTRFNDIHVLMNEGGSLAPWNIQQYKIKSINPFILKTLKTKEKIKPVFYHFHYLSFYSNKKINLTNGIYYISSEIKHYFYYPYLNHINKINKELYKDFNSKDFNGTKEMIFTIYYLRDKLYLYRKALFKLSIKAFKDANKLIKEKKQVRKNIINSGKIN